MLQKASSGHIHRQMGQEYKPPPAISGRTFHPSPPPKHPNTDTCSAHVHLAPTLHVHCGSCTSCSCAMGCEPTRHHIPHPETPAWAGSWRWGVRGWVRTLGRRTGACGAYYTAPDGTQLRSKVRVQWWQLHCFLFGHVRQTAAVKSRRGVVAVSWSPMRSVLSQQRL